MSETNEINFKGDNPGAVRYGNFINYYQFHPAEQRIQLLPNDIWNVLDSDNITCLDVGCNAGDLTEALHQYLEENIGKNVNMFGVDIDSTLILRAIENNKNTLKLTYKCLDIMKTDDRGLIKNYLTCKNTPNFSIVFCFSVTMWIHLNHGDMGLRNFLKYVCGITDILIIEPQPWKCYRTAVKRLKLTNNEFPLFKELKIRNDVENVIEDILVENNFRKIHESFESTWGRKILFYNKNS